jgi:hypothetical protein
MTDQFTKEEREIVQKIEADIAQLKESILPTEKELANLYTKLQMARDGCKKVTTDVKGKALPCEIYMDGYLYDNVRIMQNLVVHDWDNIGFYCGYEGDGKTVMCFQNALALDADFNLDNVVFLPEQFSEAVDKAPKGSSIVWDEADELASGWYSSVVLAIKQKLKRIRSHNLHIMLNTPSFFDINKYFAISRSRYLVHVYSMGTERGFFRFFNMERKQELYLKGRREWNWNAAKPAFKGRFMKLPAGFPINWEEYQAKKDAATATILAAKEGKTWPTKMKEYKGNCAMRMRAWALLKGFTVTHEELCVIFDVERRHLEENLKRSEVYLDKIVELSQKLRESRENPGGIRESKAGGAK